MAKKTKIMKKRIEKNFEWESRDVVKGSREKHFGNPLNKRELSSFEMDEIFGSMDEAEFDQAYTKRRGDCIYNEE